MRNRRIEKAPVGIEGFDFITGGGLPRGRLTLVTGPAGSGKTIFGVQFLVHGVRDHGEPGAYVGFEETEEELLDNFGSFGYGLEELTGANKLLLDHIEAFPLNTSEAGDYDLDGLFVRLDETLKSVGAKRLVLDAFPALFAGFTNTQAVRSGLMRLFSFLKSRGVTAIATAESATQVARYGLGRSLSDCVINFDTTLHGRIATRHLRVAKYRGSMHHDDEFPFLISNNGVRVMPVTSVHQDYPVSRERITTGIPSLDAMLGGGGFYRGSSILVSGEAGTGKTSIAAHFARSACLRNERSLYCAFEEAADEVVRNMSSIGLNFPEWIDQGLLKVFVSRATRHDLEVHLANLEEAVVEFRPTVMVIDPVSNLLRAGSFGDVASMISRLVDFLKSHGVTAMFTVLSKWGGGEYQESIDISSVMDAWIQLRNQEASGEHTRLLSIAKARGMPHSNQVREFMITENEIQLVDVYAAGGEVLTGSARVARLEADRRDAIRRRLEVERAERELASRRTAIEKQIAELKGELEQIEEDYRYSRLWHQQEAASHESERNLVARERWAEGAMEGASGKDDGKSE